MCHGSTTQASSLVFCLRSYPDVVLAGIRVLARVARLGIVVVALTLTEPGSDDASDLMIASANALVLHSEPSR